jgi:hypothetical protein
MVKNPEVDKLIRMYNTAKEHIDLQEGFMKGWMQIDILEDSFDEIKKYLNREGFKAIRLSALTGLSEDEDVFCMSKDAPIPDYGHQCPLCDSGKDASDLTCQKCVQQFTIDQYRRPIPFYTLFVEKVTERIRKLQKELLETKSSLKRYEKEVEESPPIVKKSKTEKMNEYIPFFDKENLRAK